jgi:hypothetical protein
MLGLAAAAACMPAQADWLNDLSLMPPVSVTMQPRKLPDAAAPVVLDALAEPAAAGDDGLAAGVLALLTLDVLLPHAAISRVAAPAATTVAHEVCLTVSSTGPDCGRPGLTRAFPRSDCPEIISLMYPV